MKRRKFESKIIHSKITNLRLKLEKSFLKNIPGVLWGAGFTFLVGVITWSFAYFGFIDLGLPNRFEFEKFDNVVRSRIPSNYTYTTQTVHFRNSEFNTVVVTARVKNAFLFTTKPADLSSDIILLLDQVNGGYKVDFKYQPNPVNVSGMETPLYAMTMKTSDINDDGRDDIAIGWSILGANFNPPAVSIFTSGENEAVSVSGIPRFKNYIYPSGYVDYLLVNAVTKQSIKTENVQGFYVGKNGLVSYVRSSDDNTCAACGEDQIYNVNFFRLENGKLIESGSPIINIKSYDNLEKTLASTSYDIDN
ncbi:MAG TPA: hypothetical protein VIM31_04675 [Candidatus Microsaccharimonas sp.]|jgi:hypothetical protein